MKDNYPNNMKIDISTADDFFLKIMKNDYALKDNYINIMKKEFLSDNIKYVQVGKIIAKEKLNQLDSIIDKLNKNLKRKMPYTRSDILRIAIKLYIHFLKANENI